MEYSQTRENTFVSLVYIPMVYKMFPYLVTLLRLSIYIYVNIWVNLYTLRKKKTFLTSKT